MRGGYLCGLSLVGVLNTGRGIMFTGMIKKANGQRIFLLLSRRGGFGRLTWP